MTKGKEKVRELPQGWCWIKLGEICHEVETRKPELEPEGEFQYIDIASIDNAIKKIVAPKKYLGKDAPSRARQIVKTDDVIFSTVRTYLMNIALVPKALNNQIASTGFCIIRGIEEVNQKYIFYYTIFYQFINSLNELQRGTSYPAVRDKDIFDQPLPLCSNIEQNRIVEKIEELFSDLDQGIESLRTTQKQLKIYRQVVLKWAFEGKLTEKWRSQIQQEKLDIKTGEELLAQIKAERKNRYQRQLEEWEEAIREWEATGKSGKKPTKPQKLKELSHLTKTELSKLFHLPEEWYWVKIGDLSTGVEYGSAAKSKKEGRVPVLRMGNIQSCVFNWSDLVFSDDEQEIEKYLLKKGDVLFNRTNSPELVGKTAIYQDERPAIFAGYLIKVNQINELVLSKYLNYFLNSITAKKHGNKVKTDGVNQSNINGDKLANYPFPYTFLREQDQIVQEIESRLSICDQLEATIIENIQKAEAFGRAF